LLARREAHAKEESVSLPVAAGTANVPSDTFAASKNCKVVVFARSTSVKTAPNALVVAAVVEPGTKKPTSTILLPIAGEEPLRG
jgi:hypothetical protein